MAYRPPVFNLWCDVLNGNTAVSRGWSLCQLRGPTNVPVYNPGPGINTIQLIFWEVLFPKWSDVRGNLQSPGGVLLGDILLIGGRARPQYRCVVVDDKAAGFSNEYRLAWVYAQKFEAAGYAIEPVDPAFAPPGGYTPLPLNPP